MSITMRKMIDPSLPPRLIPRWNHNPCFRRIPLWTRLYHRMRLGTGWRGPRQVKPLERGVGMAKDEADQKTDPSAVGAGLDILERQWNEQCPLSLECVMLPS